MLWTGATPYDAATLAREVTVVQQRIDATGVVGATVRAVGEDRLVVGFAAGVDPDPLRRLIGQRGEVAFVPLGTTAAVQGELIDRAKFPALFGADGIASASIGSDQTGQRVVTITLSPAAARLFGDYTAAHIGDYLAITVDDRVISAPVINSAIPGGSVEISQAGATDGWDPIEASEFVTVILGPLPVALMEVSSEPAAIEPSAIP